MSKTLPAILLVSLIALCSFGEESPPELNDVFQDPLLDELVGLWAMKGVLLGEPVEYSLNATWVLRHQFLLLEMRDVASPSQYEANIYIGRDANSGGYVVHWLDQFGGRASTTLGTGNAVGNAIRLKFDYPSGQFRDTFTFNSEAGTWHFHIEVQSPDGTWSDFANHVLSK